MSDDQFTQLQSQMTGLDDKFTGQMTKMQAQMATMQTEIKNLNRGFLKMFKYMSTRFDSIEKKLDDKADKSTVNLIYNQLDSFLKRTDTDEVEQTALTSRADRHEGWIQQIAKTTGDTLTY